MRSNIARTCPSSSVPERASAAGMVSRRRLLAVDELFLSAQDPEEVDEVPFLLLGEPGEGRHRRRRVLQRPPDRRLGQLVADVGQLRSWPVVAVLAELVARGAP